MKNPTVFISYSWDNPRHKEWVIALANELRRNGIDATLDEFITQRGTVNLNRMMIEKVKSKLVCNFPRSSVNPLTHPHVNIRVTITVKIPNV